MNRKFIYICFDGGGFIDINCLRQNYKSNGEYE